MLRSETVRTALIASSGLLREGLAAILRQTRFSVVESSASLDNADAFIKEASAEGLIIAVIDDSKTASSLVDLISRHARLKLVVLAKQDEGGSLPANLSEAAFAILDANVGNETL